MKAVKLAWLVGLLLVTSCRSEDPQANLLLGSWTLVGTKSAGEADWKTNGTGASTGVIFGKYGVIATGDNSLFSGGWCNKAERYTANEGKVIFSFGEPGCIPLVDPKIPTEATIVELTQQSLVLEWGRLMLKFRRGNV